MPEPSDPLAGELDALFQQLPTAHVDARNALADKLRKSGDRTSAEHVKKIKRPSPPAWAINQLWFQKPELLDTAQRATAALLSVHAQDGVSAADLTAAVAAQRRALQAALDAAVRCAAAAGLPLSSADQRKIETTLKAWLAGAGTEAPGRMTHELSASGFSAVTAVGTVSPRTFTAAAEATTDEDEPQHVEPAASTAPAQTALPLPAAKPHNQGPDPARLSRVRANVRKREQEADAARKLAELVREDLAVKETEVERTRTQLRELERAVSALSAQLKQQEAALRTSRSHSEDAGSALKDAERALGAARAELTRLTDSK